MSDGTFSIRARPAKGSDAVALGPHSDTLRNSTYDFFLPGFDSIGQGTAPKAKAAIRGDANEFSLRPQLPKKLAEHDKLLKMFLYSEALDAVLHKVRRHSSIQESDSTILMNQFYRLYGRKQPSR